MKQQRNWQAGTTGFLGSAVDELREFRKMKPTRQCLFSFSIGLLKNQIRDTFERECIPPDFVVSDRAKATGAA